MLLAFDELDAVLDQVGVEVLDLLFCQFDIVETRDDLVVCEEALLLTFCDELVELFDFRERDVDGEHVVATSG